MPHPLDGYLVRFRDMVAGLQRDPRVQVLTFWANDPAPPSELDAVEAKLGRPLGDDVRALYGQCNGLELLWARPGDRDPGGNPLGPRPGPLGWGEFNQVEQSCLGALCLLPVRQVFLDADWKGHTWFNWMKDEPDDEVEFGTHKRGRLSFSRSIRIFDYYNSFNQAAFVLDPDAKAPWPAVMGDDHGASWVMSRITDLTTYLELVLQSFASVEARRGALGQLFGTTQPPLVGGASEWTGQTPTLDEVLQGPG
jgi:hypothetical protein